MYDETLLRPAISLCTVLFTSVLLLGCADADLVAPEDEAVTEAEAITAHNANNNGSQTKTADVFGQMIDSDGELDPDDGERELYAEDAALLRRTSNGISLKVQMPTPEPGTYHYGEDTEEGHPEAFTLWVFADDVPYHGGGHVIAGETLTLSGHISKNTEPFGGEDPPEDVSEADVYITIAPHGAQNSERLPSQIKTPEATPAHWWLAEF